MPDRRRLSHRSTPLRGGRRRLPVLCL